jgi:3',5'-cyclic-nucleotide phosphodiesterase
MKFKVLAATGSELGRFHPCSFMLGDSVVVDMGAAASRLTLQEQAGITDILLSHAHLDHIKDVAFFAENIFTLGSRPVAVRSTPDTLEKIKAHLLNNQLWPDFTALPSPAKPILRYEPFAARKSFRVGGVEVFAVPVNHVGGCVALFLTGDRKTVLYTGDTGPTEEVWQETNRRGDGIAAILLEASFPNRLAKVAEESGHHTPETVARELDKIERKDVPVFIYHLKAPYQEEILVELKRIDDPRLGILEAGMQIEF